MSALERMYTYAKAVGAGARENFTTEALAAAIRTDPAPFLEFFQGAGLMPIGPIARLELETQLVLPGTGVLDLVLVAYVAGVRRELWIEVKVLAGESGNQLDAYSGISTACMPTSGRDWSRWPASPYEPRTSFPSCHGTRYVERLKPVPRQRGVTSLTTLRRSE